MKNTLTVKELIELLNTIENKERIVMIYDIDTARDYNLITVDYNDTTPIYLDFDSADTTIEF